MSHKNPRQTRVKGYICCVWQNERTIGISTNCVRKQTMQYLGKQTRVHFFWHCVQKSFAFQFANTSDGWKFESPIILCHVCVSEVNRWGYNLHKHSITLTGCICTYTFHKPSCNVRASTSVPTYKLLLHFNIGKNAKEDWALAEISIRRLFMKVLIIRDK